MATPEKNDTPFVHHSDGYNNLSLFQQNVVKIFTPHVITAAKSLVENRDDTTLTVVDYGAADGVNSVPLIVACLVDVPNLDIFGSHVANLEWIFNDLSDFDNKTNIRKVQDKLRRDVSGWEDGSVTVRYLVGNFYHQVVPHDSVDLGVCVSAAHWLSQRPPVGCNKDPRFPDEVTKGIATKDWADFLHSRAKELKRGGRLTILIGDNSPLAVTGKEFIMVGAQQVIKDMFNEAIITKEEYEFAQIFTICLRSEADIKAPFLDRDLGLRGILRLVDICTYDVPDPFYNKWIQAGGSKNASATAEFVTEYVNFTKTFYNSCWKILQVTRSREVHEATLEEFYRRVGHMVRGHLEGYHACVSVTVLDVIKD